MSTWNPRRLDAECLFFWKRLKAKLARFAWTIAPRTFQLEKNDLQRAACQVIPSGISLVLSIRELVRQGYLYGALVLMRALAERSVAILYLYRFPDKVGIWTSGWHYKKRPTLAQMFNEIGDSKFPNCGPEITRSLNSLTHGDPASSMWNLVKLVKIRLDMPSRKFSIGRIFVA
ncbi:MAG: hypothetical protein GKR89_05805 [Candidatus Latescibacteria bacterium]|nr:hypothetical protein [Candidatus Latescibacterota bacterium]